MSIKIQPDPSKFPFSDREGMGSRRPSSRTELTLYNCPSGQDTIPTIPDPHLTGGSAQPGSTELTEAGMSQGTDHATPFIVDNSDAAGNVRACLLRWCGQARSIDVATAYFDIAALFALGDEWPKLDGLRILMGDEVPLRTRAAFDKALGRITKALDDRRPRRPYHSLHQVHVRG